MRQRVTDLALVLGLAALYIVTARLGLTFDAVGGFATLVWPPTGISLAAVLLLGYRVWPGIFLGAVVTNILTGAPGGVALGIGVGNTAEALVGAFLLKSLPTFSLTLERVRDVVAFIVFAAMLSTMLSASIGVASLSAGHVISDAHVRETWRAWWIGDMVGAVVITPIILVWRNAPHARFCQHWVEPLALGTALIVVGVLTFFSDVLPLSSLQTPLHQADVLVAVLIWAALRFAQRGAATAAFAVSAMAIAATALGYGPFVQAELHHSLLSLQTFMAIVAVTFLLLGATIAERRLAHEEASAAQQEAAQANRAKSEFLAVMSHELRTPLNAIAGYSDLLKTGVYGELNEKQADAVARIHRNEKQLLSLIDEVLGYVRAEKGEVLVRREPVQVADAFDAVEPMIQSESRRKRFVFKRDVVKSPLAVQADPKSLEQILTSLLSNASKYTDEGGVVTLGAEREGAKVRIWVRDTGAGISPEEMQRVFEPFFQADRGTTRRYSGVGLGLTIARALARRMAGELIIASTVGSGTTASVVLPAA